jgi:integrase
MGSRLHYDHRHTSECQQRYAQAAGPPSEAGLPRQRFHDLRHCSASLLYSQGADLLTIMDVLGHSQMSLTANTYTHLFEEFRRDAAVRMGAALEGMS